MMWIIYSPYHACQVVTWGKCIAMGDRLYSNNPFAWEKVVLNLLGNKEYYFQRPWEFNQRVDEFFAAEIFIYVEDGRPIRPTKNVFWEASRRWGLTCSWLVIQDASRKV